MGEMIPFPVWIIPFPVLKILFIILGKNGEDVVNEVFSKGNLALGIGLYVSKSH